MTADSDLDRDKETLTSESETLREQTPKRQEVGGVFGPEPTRYGDWEKNGRCIDF